MPPRSEGVEDEADEVATVMMTADQALALLDEGEDEQPTTLDGPPIGWADPEDSDEEETYLLGASEQATRLLADPYTEPSTFEDQAEDLPRVPRDARPWVGLTVVLAAIGAALILAFAFAIAGLLLI